jgi:acetylornithine deacetylase/succinyl-diaminopimelate desuccinylase family protein
VDARKLIIEWMDPRRPELTDLLTRLIAARTENPPGNESAAAAELEAFFKRYGIPFESFAAEPGRVNLIGRIGAGLAAGLPAEAGTGGKTLLLPGHLDTVPAGDGWTLPPFTATIRGGRMHGRGSSDDKGPTAAIALAGACLKQCFQLNGTVLVAGVADEELGSALGLEYLLRERKLAADFAIVPDIAGNMKTIDLAEKGLLFVEIVSHGRQAHGSTPEKGVNALWNLIGLLNRIRDRGVPMAQHALLSAPTCNLGMMSGGAAPNIVPGRASAVLDIRFLPGQSAEQMKDWLASLMREAEREIQDARFELHEKSSLPPTETPGDNPLVRVIQDAAREMAGQSPKPSGMSGATVAKQLIARGIAAVGFAPGDSDQAHQADESVDIEELVTFAKVISLVAVRLLGTRS